MTEIPWDARWHLSLEMMRAIELVAAHLAEQRRRGRSAAGDAMRGMLIEDGEAEGLISELAQAWGEARRRGDEAPRAGSGARAAIAERARSAEMRGCFFGLRHAARAFALEDLEYDLLVLALAVELDARFGRVIGYLNDHAAHTRPSLGLALAVAGAAPWADPTLAPRVLARPIFADHLLELEGEGPLPGLSIKIARPLLARIVADKRVEPEDAGVALHAPELSAIDRLVVPEDLRARLAAIAERAKQGKARAVVLAGESGSGRRAIARAIASALGRPLAAIELSAESEAADRLAAMRREARWNDAAVLLELCPGGQVDPQRVWREAAKLPHLFLVAVPHAGAELMAAAAPAEPAVIVCEEPSADLRARLWRALLPPGRTLADEDVDRLAVRFRFGPGRIQRAIKKAEHDATLPGAKGTGPGRVPDFFEAARGVGSTKLATMARKLPLPFTRADLIVPAQVGAELELALAWMRHQRRVMERWGFGARISMGTGLTAVFAGEPGTGKTMAAQVLARELSLDLFRVDISQVISKYIGETEKNLAQLFDEAHCSGALLFFDEADALFGKRTEVSDAHDRYANVEIGYLLQRMEEYDGVTVLATNRIGDLDEAFVRRFHFIVDFPMPQEAERLRIWEGMFPAAAEKDPALDLPWLARELEISGGEIKNVVLAAAYMAAAEEKAIGMAHLGRAVVRELLKNGRAVDDRTREMLVRGGPGAAR